MSLVVIRVRLLYYLGIFALDVLGVYLNHIKPFLWSLAVVALLFVGMAHSFVSTVAQVKLEQISSVSLSGKIPHSAELFTRSQLEEKLSKYQELLTQQPNHRDVLVNISLLQKALYNQKEAYIYWESARKLDPNNQTFSTNTQQPE